MNLKIGALVVACCFLAAAIWLRASEPGAIGVVDADTPERFGLAVDSVVPSAEAETSAAATASSTGLGRIVRSAATGTT